MVNVTEGSFGKDEPVASWIRASFRGFLRREAISVMLPRWDIQSSMAINYQYHLRIRRLPMLEMAMSSRTASAPRQPH